eukprot:9125715-Pyramimonas_sp.AAC.1
MRSGTPNLARRPPGPLSLAETLGDVLVVGSSKGLALKNFSCAHERPENAAVCRVRTALCNRDPQKATYHLGGQANGAGVHGLAGGTERVSAAHEGTLGRLGRGHGHGRAGD